MRILVTAFPGDGHLQPMLPLVRAARRAGAEVVVATGPDLAPAVAARGIPVWPVGATMAESFAPRPGLPPPSPDEHVFVTAGTRVFVPAADRLVPELLPRAADWRPDVVLAETTELAGLVVADRVGARLVVHGLGPLPEPVHWADVPAFADFCARWELAGPLGGLLDTTYLDVCPPSLHLRDHAAGQDVRPLRPAAGDEGPAPDLTARIAALPHRRTVHLTLGTVVNRQPGAFDAALDGLRSLPSNLVVTTGGADVDPAALGPQPSHVVVERYLPHAGLLPHCAALVSHAGAATLLAGFWHGLPQVLLPRGGDQFDNAAAAVHAGAALALAPHEAGAEAVAAATARILDDPGFTLAAHRIRDEIAAMPVAEDVVAALGWSR